MYKYVRFFAIGDRVEWDSIKDRSDLVKRTLAGVSPDVRESVLAMIDDPKTKPGYFTRLEGGQYLVVVA